MLKVVGTIYADTEEKMKELTDTLVKSGYVMAYNTPMSAIAMKEEPEETEEN